jgi:hypothetical protein
MLSRLADPLLYVASAERVLARQLRSGDQRPLVYGAGPRAEVPKAPGDSSESLAAMQSRQLPAARALAAERGEAEGPRLAAMRGELEALGRRLAREVSRGRYAFSPVLRRQARFAGKMRLLYVAPPLDDIVIGALAQVLSELLDPVLPGGLYSYRRGRSAYSAIGAFGAYLRAHCRKRQDPRARGLYVVRRDVRNYGDAIGAGADSALWPQLGYALRAATLEPTEALMLWLQSAFRPAVDTETDGLVRPERGIPTGSALQPIACNLYLGPLDRLCEAVPGGFYARYGDDVLFAHPDPERAQWMLGAIDAQLEALGLEPSPGKCGAYYFNGAGRASPRAAFRPASALDYLGVRLDFRGAIGLPRAKLRELLGDVRSRLSRSAALLEHDDPQARAQALGAIVNAALDPSHPLAHDCAQPLRALVDDRAQLRDLDYKLSRCLAQVLAGRADVRAFREFPPRRLRAQSGLCSLVRARDQAVRRAV